MSTAQTTPNLLHEQDARPPPFPREGHGIRRILVCLDRSPHSELCLAYALSLASTFGSAITLLYVMNPPSDRFGPHTTDALGWEISRQEARGHLDRFAELAGRTSARRIDARLEQGHPAERIVAVAREVGADLTVIGSHGESGATARNLGSTAQQVLAMSRISVLIARGDTASASHASPNRILVALDGSVRAESVLPAAACLAQAHGASMLLVHVVAEPVSTAVLLAPEDVELARELATRLEARAARYLEGLRVKLAHEVPSVRALVARHADKRQFLIELSEKERIDLQDLPESELRREGEGEERLAPPLRASYPPEGS